MLLRKILDAPTSACVESLYLELGLVPIGIIIKARRVNFYHYLVNLKNEEMLYKFFEAQLKNPCKDDWTLQALQDFEDFGISSNKEFLKNKSKNAFKTIVKIKSKEFALNHLLNLKGTHSKMDNLAYSELKLQIYLRDEKIPIYEAKNLYRFRVRVANFKENFKGKYTSTGCPLCCVQIDTQAHSVQCDQMKMKIKMEGKYSDIFGSKIPIEISKTLYKISKIREDLI